MISRNRGYALVLATVGLVMMSVSLVKAQQPAVPPPPAWHPELLMHPLLASIVFGLVGIGLAIVGFKLFDWAIPYNLEKEMCENKNVAVGIFCAAIVIGVCHIVAVSIS